MGTCQCELIDEHFDADKAAEKLAAYRETGPEPTTVALVEAIAAQDVRGATLLDIGGGVGAVQHELIAAGVSSAVDVEASPAYQAACIEEAERRGHAERIRHVGGDLASVADSIGPADIVTLDRSVCCWPEMPELIHTAAARAGRFLGMVYPKDSLWVRHGWQRYVALRDRLRGDPLRVIVHRTEQIEGILASYGLYRRQRRAMGPWQVVLYAYEAS